MARPSIRACCGVSPAHEYPIHVCHCPRAFLLLATVRTEVSGHNFPRASRITHPLTDPDLTQARRLCMVTLSYNFPDCHVAPGDAETPADHETLLRYKAALWSGEQECGAGVRLQAQATG